jgi:hypothetical protein
VTWKILAFLMVALSTVLVVPEAVLMAPPFEVVSVPVRRKS